MLAGLSSPLREKTSRPAKTLKSLAHPLSPTVVAVVVLLCEQENLCIYGFDIVHFEAQAMLHLVLMMSSFAWPLPLLAAIKRGDRGNVESRDGCRYQVKGNCG